MRLVSVYIRTVDGFSIDTVLRAFAQICYMTSMEQHAERLMRMLEKVSREALTDASWVLQQSRQIWHQLLTEQGIERGIALQFNWGGITNPDDTCMESWSLLACYEDVDISLICCGHGMNLELDGELSTVLKLARCTDEIRLWKGEIQPLLDRDEDDEAEEAETFEGPLDVIAKQLRSAPML